MLLKALNQRVLPTASMHLGTGRVLAVLLLMWWRLPQMQELADEVDMSYYSMRPRNKDWVVANIPAQMHNGDGLMTKEAKRDCREKGLLSWEEFRQRHPMPPPKKEGNP